MPVSNENAVGSQLDFAEPDAGDFTNIENVFQGYSVISGGAVTAQGSPNGTVAVAAGVAKVGHVAVTITAGNVSVISGSANPDGTTATAADSAMARFSLVTINSSGQLGVLHGTPAGLGPNNDGSYLDVFPTFAGKTILAAVRVLPLATTVTSAAISEKRILHTDGDFVSRAITPSTLSGAANDYAPTGLSTANTIRQATNSTTQRNISGIVPTGFTDGKVLYLHNLGPGPIALLDESTNSSAANRFSLTGDLVLPVDRSVELLYDSTSSRWRVVGGQTAAGAPTITLGSTAASGALAYYLASDATIAAFDATVPVTQAYSDVAATGSAAFAARRDHKHGMPAGASGGATTSGLRISDDMFYGTTVITTSGTPLGPAAVGFTGAASRFTPNALTGTASHPGVGSLDTGNTTTGMARIFTGGTSILLGGGRARYGAWVNIPVLSTGSERFEVFAGFLDAGSLAGTVDGAFFYYKDTVNSGKWEAVTIANSVSTATVTDTGVAAIQAATWYFLEAEVNVAGTSVTYYVNGASVVTHAANIPTGAGRETGFAIGILKSVGSTLAALNIDAYYLELDFTTSR